MHLPRRQALAPPRAPLDVDEQDGDVAKALSAT
jgi:hypothetical protein